MTVEFVRVDATGRATFTDWEGHLNVGDIVNVNQAAMTGLFTICRPWRWTPTAGGLRVTIPVVATADYDRTTITPPGPR